jgi:hypothetical protein
MLDLEAEDVVDRIGVEWRRQGMRWPAMEDSGGRRWRIAVGVGIGPGEAAEEGYPALLVWVGGGAAIGERDRDGEMGRTGDQKKKSMMPTDHRNLWGKRKEKCQNQWGSSVIPVV